MNERDKSTLVEEALVEATGRHFEERTVDALMASLQKRFEMVPKSAPKRETVAEAAKRGYDEALGLNPEDGGMGGPKMRGDEAS